MGRLMALCVVAASVFIQCMPVLPSVWVAGATAVILASLLVILRLVSRLTFKQQRIGRHIAFRYLFRVLVLILAIVFAATWFIWRAELRLNDYLSPEHENVVTKTSFLITGLIQDQGENLRFEAEIMPDERNLSPNTGIPRYIQIVWRKPLGEGDGTPLRVVPGQVWRAALIFRRPRSALNPHGFDYEAHLLSRNIRAIGRVRGNPLLVREDPFFSIQVIASGARHYLRSAMRKHISDMSFGAVLIALAIGDQDSVDSEHWEIFNKTGITHLVSISGSHVTMLAAFGGFSIFWLWKRMRWQGRAIAERVPAKVIAAIAALCVAWMYCLLAGWGVPARRTFFMLLVSGFAMLNRLPVRASSVLCLSAAVVTMIDPWSPISTGFWLSYGAVSVLFYLGSQSQQEPVNQLSNRVRFWNKFKESARLQWMITLSMLSTLAFLFQQVSISSPLANAIAIPVVTFIVTPLALLMGVLALFPWLDSFAGWVAWFAHLSLAWCMVPVTWLAYASWSDLSVPATPVWCLLLSLIGVTWALQPPGLPHRWVGWSLILPAMTWQPERPVVGGWKMIAMDVGQGSSLLIQTRNHVLIFDVGPRVGPTDAGYRVVSPLVRALGINKIDVLVVSHPDIDHAGGVPGLLRQFRVQTSYTSFDLDQWLSRTQRMLKQESALLRPSNMFSCEFGHKWIWDEVEFIMLHPAQEVSSSYENLPAIRPNVEWKNFKKTRTNAQSCVLHVRGKFHSALLPGDIGTRQEEEILKRLEKINLNADVVIVAHHGSETSSSQRFVSQIRPQHAIVQSGYLNRFSHPSETIQKRWRDGNALLWRTDQHGAITAMSNPKGLMLSAESESRRRYWHDRPKLKEKLGE